jgi:hypothetical protein
MDNYTKKQSPSDKHALDGGMQRRRIARIVHDDRGNASVNWLDAPSDYKRPVLEVEDEPGALAIQKPPQTFDPYARATLPGAKRAPAARKDLRKLSEWIKMMRELEERKRNE